MGADFLDDSKENEMAATEAAIEKQRSLAAPQQKRLPNGDWEQTECEDCGEDIEPQRLDMGRIRCFSCQSAYEEKDKLYAKR